MDKIIYYNDDISNFQKGLLNDLIDEYTETITMYNSLNIPSDFSAYSSLNTLKNNVNTSKVTLTEFNTFLTKTEKLIISDENTLQSKIRALSLDDIKSRDSVINYNV